MVCADNQLVEEDCHSRGGSTVGESFSLRYKIFCQNS